MNNKIQLVILFIESLFIGCLLCLPLVSNGILWPISIFILIYFFWRTESLINQKFVFFLYYLSFGLGWYIGCANHLFSGLYISAKLSFWLSFFAWFSIGVYCCSFLWLIALLHFKLRYFNPWLKILAIGCCWCLFEWMRTWLFTGFSLFSLGYIFNQGPLSGYAAIGSVIMISLASIVIAMLLALTLRKQLAIQQSAVISLIILGIGGISQQYTWSSKTATELKIALIQTGDTISDRHDDIDDWDKKMLLQTEHFFEQVDRNTELVVTPESYNNQFLSAYPVNFFYYLKTWAEQHSASLLFGTYQLINDNLQHHGYFYFASVFLPHQQLILPLVNGQTWWQRAQEVYHKRDLIPFSEYVPTWGRALGLKSWLPLGNGRIGERKKIIWQIKPGFVISPSLCYELYFGNNIRDNAIGADLLINQGYQGWYIKSFGIAIMQKVAKIRALEAARPVLRVDGYGISELIDPKANQVFALPESIATVKQIRVNAYTGETWYYRFGYLPLILVLALAWMLYFLSLLTNKKGIQ